MDTSEIYIKMCGKAEEIQEKWKPTIGDYIGGEWFVDKEDNIGLCCLGVVVKLNPEGHKDCVSTGGDIFWAIETHYWLPRQDQLQGMMGNWRHCLSELCDTMEFGGYPWNLLNDLSSFEQLWLAFVMNELYSKKWDGTEWR